MPESVQTVAIGTPSKWLARLARAWVLVSLIQVGCYLNVYASTNEARQAKVLILNSYHPGYRFSDNELRGVIDVLQDQEPPLLLLTEYLDFKRFWDIEHVQRIHDNLKVKYHDTDLSVIIALDDPGLRFALTNRPTLFPNVPIVFCGCNEVNHSTLASHGNVTGIFEVVDARGTLQLITSLQPAAKRLVVLHDGSEAALSYMSSVRSAAAEVKGGLKEVTSLDVHHEQFELLLGKTEPSSAVVLAGLGYDATGRLIAWSPRFANSLSNICKAPIYQLFTPSTALPVVGGSTLSPYLNGRKAGELVLKVLSGTPAASIPLVNEPICEKWVDAMQANRWRLDLGLLPQGYTIKNRPLSAFERNPSLAPILVSMLLTLGVGVVVLAINVRKRKDSEERLRLNEVRLQALIKLTQMSEQPLLDIAHYAMEEGVRLTESSHGYLAFTNEDESILNMYAWTGSAMAECQVKDRSLAYPLVTTGLWGEAVRQRKPIITNDYNVPCPHKHGLPKGHVGIIRHMNVPVFDGKRIVAVAGVANKLKPYDNEDVHQLTLLMEGMWLVVKRKQAEDALRQSEAKLLQSQRIGNVGSWELDLRTQRLEWSTETYRIFGKKPGEFIPTRESFRLLVHPDDREKVQLAMVEADEKEVPYRIDHRIVLDDGTIRVVHENAEITRDSSGKALLLSGTVQDITERRQLEEQFRQAQKMEAVGQLAGGIAHDFNNILTVIQGHADLLITHEGLPADAMESLREVHGAAQRAAHLTQQLLAFSRRQVLQIKPLSLNQQLTAISRMLHRLLGENIQFELRCAPDLPLIDADAGMVDQVIVNLAVNARDAMRQGGRLVIQTSEHTVHPAEVHHKLEARLGHFVRLSVSDTGCGMDRATLQRIFEPFFTTKEFGKGTGLGLAMVYGIVKQHDGWVEVESEPNQGTTFHIHFPTSSEVVTPKRDAITSQAAGGGSETILMVEDETSVRTLARKCLQRLGYTVLEAANGMEALHIWQDKRDAIQLLLTDQIMPEGMTGHELATVLRGEKPDLKVIYSSGYSLEMASEDFHMEAGAAFLPKPYEPARLASVVRSCLDGQTPAG